MHQGRDNPAVDGDVQASQSGQATVPVLPVVHRTPHRSPVPPALQSVRLAVRQWRVRRRGLKPPMSLRDLAEGSGVAVGIGAALSNSMWALGDSGPAAQAAPDASRNGAPRSVGHGSGKRTPGSTRGKVR